MEALKFDEWMRKIKNIHYPDNEKMLIAYKKVNNNSKTVKNEY